MRKIIRYALYTVLTLGLLGLFALQYQNTQLQKQKRALDNQAVWQKLQETNQELLSVKRELIDARLHIRDLHQTATDALTEVEHHKTNMNPAFDTIFTKALSPSVRINLPEGTGSGTLVGNATVQGTPNKYKGYAITALHVVEDVPTLQHPYPITLELFDKDGKVQSSVRARLVLSQKPYDLALLETQEQPAPLPTAQLAQPESFSQIAVYDRIFAVGCPLGFSPQPVRGELSSLRKLIEDETFWMVTAQTTYGNSGGGVYWGKDHKYIGMTSRVCSYGKSHTTVPHLGVLTPITTIDPWLAKSQYKFLRFPHQEYVEPMANTKMAHTPSAKNQPGVIYESLSAYNP